LVISSGFSGAERVVLCDDDSAAATAAVVEEVGAATGVAGAMPNVGFF
jgi:hypothetical protein